MVENIKCRSCFATNLKLILDLGCQPWCNGFLKKENFSEEVKYPLRLVLCPECTLLQLDFTIPKEAMFSNHTYLSGTTKTLRDHFMSIASTMKSELNLSSSDFIVDIGGNDGTQLLQYKKLGCENTLNVESANNITEISINNGIKTINAFFNEDLVCNELCGFKAKLINASGVFFHLEELHSVIRGIKNLLDDDGVLVVQFMYVLEMMKNLNFDTIYHEHLCYYTLRSLINLLAPYDLFIYDSHWSDIHSGSIIAKVAKKRNQTERHLKLLAEEDQYLQNHSLDEFAVAVKQVKTKICAEIHQKRDEGKIIYGYGAPAKGNTLLNYCELGSDIISKLVEVNQLKIGLYSPGMHIPIVDEYKVKPPDCYFVLAHNFKSEILTKNLNSKTEFIFPFRSL